MEARDFSLENLQHLFKHISKDYPLSENLNILVHTDWSQLGLPSDCPGTGMSGGFIIKEDYDFHQARFQRRGKTAYFYYSKELKTPDLERVDISE